MQLKEELLHEWKQTTEFYMRLLDQIKPRPLHWLTRNIASHTLLKLGVFASQDKVHGVDCPRNNKSFSSTITDLEAHQLTPEEPSQQVVAITAKYEKAQFEMKQLQIHITQQQTKHQEERDRVIAENRRQKDETFELRHKYA